MQLERETGGGNVIRSYSNGELLINHEIYRQPVLLTADNIITDWSPPAIKDLTPADFQFALDEAAELILLGSGQAQIFPANQLITAIMRSGIGFEVMDTGAACRTFNVLAAEQRRVVAALYPR